MTSYVGNEDIFNKQSIIAACSKVYLACEIYSVVNIVFC